MEFLKNHKKRLIKAVFLMPLSIILAFYLIYPHQYPYIDIKILGSTRGEVIEMYGNPFHEGTLFNKSYIAYKATQKPTSIQTRRVLRHNGGTTEGVWYYIFFDDNGLAREVDIGLQAMG